MSSDNNNLLTAVVGGAAVVASLAAYCAYESGRSAGAAEQRRANTLPSHVFNELRRFFGGSGVGASARTSGSASAVDVAAVDASSASASEVELPLPVRETEKNPALEVSKLSSKLSLDDVEWEGKRVLMRVDYNVPIRNGVVTDDTRVAATMSTLKHILGVKGKKGGCKCIVLITHLGRPAGDYDREKFSLKHVVPVLEKYLPGTKIRFLEDCVGEAVEQAIASCTPGTVFLTENLRFHIEETGSGVNAQGQKVKATPEAVTLFRRQLSRLGDLYVFEAFGAAHRPHSSVVGIDIEQRVAGKLMQREMDVFAKVLGQPQRPFLAILGGSKVSDKINVIINLLDIVDEMIIGGGMAYTFKRVLEDVQIGGSLFDRDSADVCHAIVKKAKERGVKLHFPVDHVIADNFSADARIGVTDDATGIPDDWMALDIGPQSRSNNAAVIARAKTVLWNGPLGVFELGAFATGTLSAFWQLVDATQGGANTIIGGGDTGAASKLFYVGRETVSDQVSHVSTGGGSSLVLMEGKSLPGIEALSDCRAD